MFYTDVQRLGNVLLVRGWENGKRFSRRVSYSPVLFLPTEEDSEFKTLFGNNVKPKTFENMRAATEFYREYQDVENFHVYGMNKYEYAYISETFEQNRFDFELIRVANIDIEVASDDGFPEVTKADKEVTAITLKHKNIFHVLGCGDFVNKNKNVIYYKCKNELDLLEKFLSIWERIDPDVVTGWHIRFFDIPYLVNRMKRLKGDDFSKRLSPWGIINSQEVSSNFGNSTQITYNVYGIQTLDYLELYRKFEKMEESYRLDHIAHVVLDERKLNYSEYSSLHELYKLNYQKFIEYNIKDVDLVDRIDKKIKLIEMVIAIAYFARTNYQDVFAQTRLWDSIIHSHLMEKGIVIPPIEHKSKDTAYVGAYVKSPQVGMHEWVVSFDLNSLYPSLIQQFNLGPETIINDIQFDLDVEDFLNKTDTFKLASETAHKSKASMSGNGYLFSNDKQSFLSELMEMLYKKRSDVKKEMIQHSKDKEKVTDQEEKKRLEALIASKDVYQKSLKVTLNSAYGAVGSEFFRFYDTRIATAVTVSGQVVIRWVEKHINSYLNNILKTEDEDYVIASDTDSVYINMKPLVDLVFKDKDPSKEEIVKFLDKISEEKINPYFKKIFDELKELTNSFKQNMFMAREVIADRGVWTAKKRYALNVHNSEGIQYKKPKLKIMGIEAVRSSTPEVCRIGIKGALHHILKKDEKHLQAYVKAFEKKFKSLRFDQIAFPRGVNDINKWVEETGHKKGTPIHVRGCIVYNNQIRKNNLQRKYELIRDGDKILFGYLIEPNQTGQNVISCPHGLPSELNLDNYIDYDVQLEKTFIEPLKAITSKIGWQVIKKGSLLELFE